MNDLSQKPEPYQSLNYSDPALIRQDRTRNWQRHAKPSRWKGFVRRGCLGAGLALILLGYAEFQYRGPSSMEVFFCWGVGGVLFGAAIPAVRARRARTID